MRTSDLGNYGVKLSTKSDRLAIYSTLSQILAGAAPMCASKNCLFREVSLQVKVMDLKEVPASSTVNQSISYIINFDGPLSPKPTQVLIPLLREGY